ncbi:MAG: tetratricopeptide repeat protein [Rikenellaceae bacterium]|nr:tetratricopeptide repeat protein [Rikenellaceae bacterium]
MKKNPEKIIRTEHDIPELVPQGDDTFKIIYPSSYGKDIRFANNPPQDIDEQSYHSRLLNIIKKYPYNFEAALALSNEFTDKGAVDKACGIRFEACQRINDLLPEDEEIELSWSVKENRTLIFLLNYSAVDHFIIGDFEVASALFETCLDVDPEDHLDCSKMLVYCYIALNDEEAYRAKLLNVDPKDMEVPLIELWASYRFNGGLDDNLLQNFKSSHPRLYKEFISDTHDAGGDYIKELDSGRMSHETRARQIWFKTEPLWERFGDFIVLLKADVKP